MSHIRAVDGDFNMNVGSTETSFEDFLTSIGETPENTENLYNEDGLYDIEEDNTYESSDEEDIVEEFFDNVMEDEDSEDEDDEFDPEDEEDQEETTDQYEGYDYELEDWESEITLPNGVSVSAQDLYEFHNFKEAKQELEVQKNEIKQKEEIFAQDTGVSLQAISLMEQRLIQKAQSGAELNMYDQAQYQVLNQMKHFMGSATQNLQQAAIQHQAMQQKAREEILSRNIDIVFDRYPTITNDLPEIKEYLKEKGVADPTGYLESVQMDPAVIAVLQDAVKVNKTRSKIQGKSPVKRTSKALKSSLSRKQIDYDSDNSHDFTGIPSTDLPNYKAFLQVMK